MLIVGAKGFAKEVLVILHQLNEFENVVFYDDINKGLPEKLFEKFSILTDLMSAKKYFKETDSRFTIGIGNPFLRKKMFDKFTSIGGIFSSTISPFAKIGNFGNEIGLGSNIMTGAVVTSSVFIDSGVLINLNSTIGHDSVIEKFVEISPGVNVSGNCRIGSYSVLGTNSTILPEITIGTNVIVAAGAVVTKDVPDNSMVVGVPAKIIKQLTPLQF